MAGEKICGIYQIRNLVNGKVYIGSTNNIELRWRQHRSNFRRNNHANKHLQNSWNKHGKDNFRFEIVEIIKKESRILEREQWYLDNVIKWGLDYNVARDAVASMRGMVVSQETKNKMSKSMTGKTLSQETKDKISETLKGRSLSEETKKKLSKSGKGRKFSKDTRRKISDSHVGRKTNSRSSSSYIGVGWDKGMMQWRVRVRIISDRKNSHVGRYKSEIVAAQNYDLSSIIHHKGKYPLNFEKLKPRYEELIKQGITKITEEIK